MKKLLSIKWRSWEYEKAMHRVEDNIYKSHHTPYKGLGSRTYKELLQLNNKQLKNGQRTWMGSSLVKIRKWPTDTREV